jgi:hypothetical protein
MSDSLRLSTPSGTAIGEEALTALVSALFCTSLQPVDSPCPDHVRREVLHVLGEDLTDRCRAQLAQATADNPAGSAARVAWCRQTILQVFCGNAGSNAIEGTASRERRTTGLSDQGYR